MNIRFARETDIDRINDLLYQVCAVHREGRPDLFKAGGKKYTDAELVEIIHNEKTPILVAADENDVIQGYAFCIFKQYVNSGSLTDVKTLYIDDLCVDAAARGKHIGTSLYNAVLDFARENGCYNVTLNVWTENKSAVKFYERQGLKPQKIGMETIL